MAGSGRRTATPENVELWQWLMLVTNPGTRRTELGARALAGNEHADALANRGVEQALGRR